MNAHDLRVNAGISIIQRFLKEYDKERAEIMAFLEYYPEDHVSDYMREKITDEAFENMKKDDIPWKLLEKIEESAVDGYQPEGEDYP